MVGFQAYSLRILDLLAFTVFRRVIAAVLILTIFGYGSAWAFDVHEGHAGDHEHALGHEEPGSDMDAGDCDHCCHAAAHLIGIPPGASVIPGQARAVCRSPVHYLAATREYAPPHKPPRD